MARPEEHFAAEVLKGVGAPVTDRNVSALIGWSLAEDRLGGGAWRGFNPLNTTQGAPGARNINSVGVKRYPNFNAGVTATVRTLTNGRYGGILGALRSNNADALPGAIGASPWGTSGSVAAQTIRSQLGKWHAPADGAITPGSAAIGGGRGVTMLVPGRTVTTGGNVDWQAVAAATLKRLAAKPIDTSGHISAANPLKAYVSAAESGQFLTPVAVHRITPASSENHFSPAPAGMPGEGDINPFMHFKVGHTDQGIDANAAPGTPIRALNDSRVVGILPNWYKGQPYVWMKILKGPNAGKFWYVAEEITHLPRIGQVIPRGGVVARYAPSGTGVEGGWATASGSTLARATTGYSEGQATPAGQSFRRLV